MNGHMLRIVVGGSRGGPPNLGEIREGGSDLDQPLENITGKEQKIVAEGREVSILC